MVAKRQPPRGLRLVGYSEANVSVIWVFTPEDPRYTIARACVGGHVLVHSPDIRHSCSSSQLLRKRDGQCSTQRTSLACLVSLPAVQSLRSPHMLLFFHHVCSLRHQFTFPSLPLPL